MSIDRECGDITARYLHFRNVAQSLRISPQIQCVIFVICHCYRHYTKYLICHKLLKLLRCARLRESLVSWNICGQGADLSTTDIKCGWNQSADMLREWWMESGRNVWGFAYLCWVSAAHRSRVIAPPIDHLLSVCTSLHTDDVDDDVVIWPRSRSMRKKCCSGSLSIFGQVCEVQLQQPQI